MSEQILRLAHSYYAEKVSRSSTSNLPILNELSEAGCIEPIPFGADIRQPTILASNLPDPTDMDGNGITSQSGNATTSAIYSWKVVPKRVNISMEQLNLKGSPLEQVKWINGEIVSSVDSLLLAVELMLQSDASTAGGLAFDGIRGAVSTTPSIGTWGEIDRAVEERWRNKAFNALDGSSSVPDAGNTTSLSNILARFKYIINSLTVNKNGCTHAFLSSDLFEMIDTVLEDKQRTMDTEVANLGYQRIIYKGVKIVNTGGMQRASSGSLLGFPEKTAIFMTLRPEKVCFKFYDRFKHDAKFRELIAYEKNPEEMPFDLARVVAPNAENGILLHKNASNSTYYIEERITGNMAYGDLQATAILFEQDVPTPDFNLDATSGSVAVGATKDFTVTVVDGLDIASISVESSDTSKATATISGNKITVTGVATGSATITVKSSAISKTIPIAITITA